MERLDAPSRLAPTAICFSASVPSFAVAGTKPEGIDRIAPPHLIAQTDRAIVPDGVKTSHSPGRDWRNSDELCGAVHFRFSSATFSGSIPDKSVRRTFPASTPRTPVRLRFCAKEQRSCRDISANMMPISETALLVGDLWVKRIFPSTTSPVPQTWLLRQKHSSPDAAPQEPRQRRQHRRPGCHHRQISRFSPATRARRTVPPPGIETGSRVVCGSLPQTGTMRPSI